LSLVIVATAPSMSSLTVPAMAAMLGTPPQAARVGSVVRRFARIRANGDPLSLGALETSNTREMPVQYR